MMKTLHFILLFILSAFLLLSCGTESTPIYTLTTSVSGEGTITPSSGEFKEGEVVTLTSSPNNGWLFESWGGDANGDSNPYKITMDGDKNIIANFILDSETEIVEVTSFTGRIWMDRNLGAERRAISSMDSLAYGDLYQWGRQADGHQKRNSNTTSTLSATDTPNHGEFILSPDSPNDWRTTQNDNLWQGVNGANNPCPDGFRLPTINEWDEESRSWASNDAAGAIASPLKLTMSDFRRPGNGSLGNINYGYYSTSTVSDSRINLFLLTTSEGMTEYYITRASGLSVRCIKD